MRRQWIQYGVVCASFRVKVRGYMAAEKEIALVQLLLTWKLEMTIASQVASAGEDVVH
jgi:hypothetical protein